MRCGGWSGDGSGNDKRDEQAANDQRALDSNTEYAARDPALGSYIDPRDAEDYCPYRPNGPQWEWQSKEGGKPLTKWEWRSQLQSSPQSNRRAFNTESGFKYRSEASHQEQLDRKDLHDQIVMHANRLGLPDHVTKAAWQKLTTLDDLRMGGVSIPVKALGALTFVVNEDSRLPTEMRLIRQREDYKERLAEIDGTPNLIRRVRRHIRKSETEQSDTDESAGTATA